MKCISTSFALALTLGSFAAGSPALAHAVLDKVLAPAGQFYKGVITITHGCKQFPTTRVRIKIPLGVKRAKPMPKQGWEVKAAIEKLDEPYDFHGRMITEDVRELVWSGGNLPGNFIDEFTFQALMPERVGQTIYFKTVQECSEGVHRWIETPEPGKSRSDYREPAPGVILTGRP
jgi:uncharacterized protein YcnI